MSPIVRGETLTYRQNEQEQELAVDTPAWFAWLETASTFSFASEEGLFTARHERSSQQRGGRYWKAYRKQHGKLSSHYLGKSEVLTLERLQAVARALANPPARIPPARAASAAVPPARSTAQRAHGDPFTPLLSTKLHVPRLRAQLVSRPQLTEHFQAGIQGSLTLISAPAGFGKTTLLAQWRAESHMPVAWLSLETEDNEPVRFFSYLIATLQTLDPGIGTSALGLLQTPQPAALEAVLTLLTNDLSVGQAEDFALVLDDYHLITAEPIHRSVTYLVEHLPLRMHLVLATRADPPLPLARLRAGGQLCEVRAADLRFATEETSTFLQSVMGLALSPQEIDLVQSRTEGWIAGLQFAALSLRGRAPSHVSTYLASFSGSNRFVLDYLSEEVLARQPAEVQAFLLHTSILDRLSRPLCEAVTEQKGSQAMLEALERANLFVAALDDERGWYRYHPLFAEVLSSRLQQVAPGLVPELHRRASSWYEQHEMLVEAVQHALAAPDLERAARLIEQHGMSFALQGGVQTVLGWLDALPDAMVRTHARLCLYSALMLMFTNQLDAAEIRLHDAEKCVQADMSPDFARSILGWVAAVRANLALFSGDLARCIALAQQTLALVPETEVLLRSAAATGPAHAFLVNGDVTAEVERLVAATAAPLRATGDLFALLTSMTLLARLQVLQGRLRQAATTYEQVVHVVPGRELLQVLVGSAGYYFGRGDLLREWNDLDEASRFLAQGMELVRGTLTVDATVVTQGYTALARLEMARRDYGRALATLDAFTQLARQRHFVPHLVAHGLAVRAQVELAQDHLAAVIRWADASGLSTEDDLSYLHEREYLTLARVRITQGRKDSAGNFLQDALGLLARLLEDAEAKARMGSVLEILLLRALAFDAQGQRTQALAALERALLLAEPEGYIRLFVDEGGPMLALLRQAHARGIAPGYVATLLSAFGELGATASLLRTSCADSLVEPLSERELAVLRLLVAGLSNAAMAQELVITVGTVKRHVNSIYTKLGVTSRTQAVARVHALQLL
ncbi:MAG TPA: LuxR C-terminal-related transcriptional regulator [Ktedonobacteraceae bacterium]